MFEIESYVVHDGHVQLRQRVIPPRGEARNDYLIFAELAQRLGYGDRWPQTEGELIDYALQGTGITQAELRRHPQGVAFDVPPMVYRKYEKGLLRADGQTGFNTPSGKFEITSEWFREHGYEPLPAYTEPQEGPLGSPGVAEQFPLVFNSGARTQFGFRSQHHNIPSLVAKQPHPLVHIHYHDAAARGISQGDEVLVLTPRPDAVALGESGTRLVKELFAERRKQIGGLLRRGRGLTEADLAEMDAGCGIDPRQRAETLSPADFLALDRWLADREARA